MIAPLSVRFLLILVLAGDVVVVSPAMNVARAELVATASVLTPTPEVAGARERVHAFLNRTDVRQYLQEQGVSADEAQERVDALSDTEVTWIAGKIDQLPAGGSVLGALLAVLLIIILVLILTDILGYTDVFPWVNPAPRQ